MAGMSVKQYLVQFEQKMNAFESEVNKMKNVRKALGYGFPGQQLEWITSRFERAINESKKDIESIKKTAGMI